MNQGKRLLFYIVLNILVSACTTLAVLWLWDRPHQVIATFLPAAAQNSLEPAVLPSSTPSLSSLPAPTRPAAGAPTSPPATPSLAAAGAAQIVIDNIFGIGDLKDEYVLIKSTGDGELDLTGWRLDDGNGNVYKFPSITLFKGGAVQVHTAAGINSVVDLYWGRDAAVWQEGKIVTLADSQGNVRATYRIP